MKSYRYKLLTFSGSDDVKVELDTLGEDGYLCFRKFDDGVYKSEDPNKPIVIKTRHPNILYSVIKGKKCWGLWVKEWSMGIAECSFTKEEILSTFKERNIEIPESFLKELDNSIQFWKRQKYDNEWNRRNVNKINKER